MQNDPNANKQYFFDDDDASIKFAFETPEDRHSKDLETPFILKDSFTTKSNVPGAPGRGLYALHSKLLAYYKNESDTTPELIIDLLHSRVSGLKSSEGESEYGFSIMKNGCNYEFFSSDRQVIENWLSALKKVCVLTSFHDDYKAIKMIGRGSFAKVYLVESKTSGKSFAVKAFTKETMAVSNKSNAKPSMLNEIGIMRALDHENIIKLYEVYETEKSIYLVLELIQGKSLYDFLKKTNFKEEVSLTRIINMVRSLLDALAYLASKGIMHRDLKPDNILLDKGEKVKIVDFGLATFIDLPTYIFKKCGTPGYIAPEVFRYDDKEAATFYNDRCDVFSVGSLLYYMLYNTPLFGGTTAADILKLNRKYAGDYPILNNIKLDYKDPNGKISKDGLNLLLDLLEADMKKRISASTALNHSFFIPVPTGMQKVVGSNEFVVDALSKHSQNEIYSPCSPLKTNFLAQDQVYSPLTPHRIDTMEINSPLLPTKQDRFVKEDSLYLDVGRPEINGRIDTITNGSVNNSLLLASRVDSSNNIASPCLPSAFAKKSTLSRAGTATNKTYKPHGPGAGNQSFLKAAIFRNMQKNNSEGLRDEDTLKSRIGEYRAESGTGDESPVDSLDYNEQKKRDTSQSPEKKSQSGQEGEEIGNENDGSPLNFERANLIGHGKTTTKPSSLKMRKFQPFAPGNLIIPKNDTHNGM